MYLILILVFLLGLVLGSFANSLIWRLANDISFKGRSKCPNCRQKIKYFDNIPLISFIILKAKCRYCKQKISWQYPLVEFSVALLFLLVFLKISDFQIVSLGEYWSILSSGAIWQLLRDLLAVFLLTIIFVFDWRYLLIPVNLLLIFTPFFWLFNILLGISWWLPLLSAAIVTCFFLFQFLITKGKGLGEGDIWLGASLGFLFPLYHQLIVAILLAYFIGSIIGIVFIIFKKKKWQAKLPLGTFLVIASIISMFFADNIWQYYWNFWL